VLNTRYGRSGLKKTYIECNETDFRQTHNTNIVLYVVRYFVEKHRTTFSTFSIEYSNSKHSFVYELGLMCL
jgi:hypothetical protein